MKTEYYPRTTDDYINMGYNPEASATQANLDKDKFDEEKPNQKKKVKGTLG
jgi:hypothetical protein